MLLFLLLVQACLTNAKIWPSKPLKAHSGYNSLPSISSVQKPATAGAVVPTGSNFQIFGIQDAINDKIEALRLFGEDDDEAKPVLITDKRDDVRIILSEDGTKGDKDVGNRPMFASETMAVPVYVNNYGKRDHTPGQQHPQYNNNQQHPQYINNQQHPQYINHGHNRIAPHKNAAMETLADIDSKIPFDPSFGWAGHFPFNAEQKRGFSGADNENTENEAFVPNQGYGRNSLQGPNNRDYRREGMNIQQDTKNDYRDSELAYKVRNYNTGPQNLEDEYVRVGYQGQQELERGYEPLQASHHPPHPQFQGAGYGPHNNQNDVIDVDGFSSFPDFAEKLKFGQQRGSQTLGANTLNINLTPQTQGEDELFDRLSESEDIFGYSSSSSGPDYSQSPEDFGYEDVHGIEAAAEAAVEDQINNDPRYSDYGFEENLEVQSFSLEGEDQEDPHSVYQADDEYRGDHQEQPLHPGYTQGYNQQQYLPHRENAGQERQPQAGGPVGYKQINQANLYREEQGQFSFEDEESPVELLFGETADTGLVDEYTVQFDDDHGVVAGKNGAKNNSLKAAEYDYYDRYNTMHYEYDDYDEENNTNNNVDQEPYNAGQQYARH